MIKKMEILHIGKQYEQPTVNYQVNYVFHTSQQLFGRKSCNKPRRLHATISRNACAIPTDRPEMHSMIIYPSLSTNFLHADDDLSHLTEPTSLTHISSQTKPTRKSQCPLLFLSRIPFNSSLLCSLLRQSNQLSLSSNINARRPLLKLQQFQMQKNNWETQAQWDSQGQQLPGTYEILSMPETHIQDVWASNFHEEMKKLMKLSEKFNVIAMDTEFPGIIATRCELDQRYYSEQECEYFLVKRNVEETKMIQIGLSIADEEGNVPHPVCTWQFNFRFDKDKDRIVDQSYDLLIKAGVRFDKLVSEGIDYALFAEYFAGSGLVLNKKMKWVVFHGSSDFAYLLRLVVGEELPQTIDDFYKTMKTYFPNIYDLKYIIKDIPGLKDVGLAKLSYEIGCNRIGPQHQAGSDSLLTLACYFKMLEKQELFNQVQFSSCLNIIFGIGLGFIKTSSNGFSNPRDYQDNNSYLSREYDYAREYSQHDYYERSHSHGHYMNQLHPYLQTMPNNYTGPLYQYLHHQQQPNMYHNYMYSQEHTQQQQKRY